MHIDTAPHIVAGSGSASGFTNEGGIRFSDFGYTESPRFTAQMIPSRTAATASRSSSIGIANSKGSDADRSKWMGHNRGDHHSFGLGFRRYPRYGVWIFGGYGAPFCGPIVGDGFDLDYLNYAGAFDCYGGGTFGMMFGPTADWLGSDVGDEYAGPYAAGDEPAADAADDAAATDASRTAAPQVTMLQLKDGSVYGLTAYWVEGGELHYVTNYGGENVIPLDQIDLAKTVALNASRGQGFVLAAKPAPGKSAH